MYVSTVVFDEKQFFEYTQNRKAHNYLLHSFYVCTLYFKKLSQ